LEQSLKGKGEQGRSTFTERFKNACLFWISPFYSGRSEAKAIPASAAGSDVLQQRPVPFAMKTVTPACPQNPKTAM
jgi:hypothetical protein